MSDSTGAKYGPARSRPARNQPKTQAAAAAADTWIRTLRSCGSISWSLGEQSTCSIRARACSC